jgi:hypothetical protein
VQGILDSIVQGILDSILDKKRGNGMQDITVDKGELLAILKENRAQHLTVYKEARAGYIKARMREAQDWLELLDAGKFAPSASLLDRPEKHEDDYDGVISMLEMDLGTIITLDERTYRQLVMDQWHWRRQTLRKFSSYAPASTFANYGAQDSDDEGDF